MIFIKLILTIMIYIFNILTYFEVLIGVLSLSKYECALNICLGLCLCLIKNCIQFYPFLSVMIVET